VRWRSLSNLTINLTGGTGCQAATDFWAVSQAAPMRRVQVNGKVSLMDYCNGSPDYASGGFIADSAFTGSTVINGLSSSSASRSRRAPRSRFPIPPASRCTTC